MDIMLNRIIELIGNKRGASKEFADAIGIPANLITDWKAGRNKSYPKYAPQIAERYNVSLDWLSGLTDEKEKPAPISEDGLDDVTREIMNVVKQLSVERQRVVLAQAKALEQMKEG